MDNAILTGERLRFALNANQVSRERLCIGILGLDRNYSQIKPRRAAFEPDDARDIECLRLGQLCYGAVGFQDNASESPEDKRHTIRKFEDKVIEARVENSRAKAFVFFCNIDLTPNDITELEDFAKAAGFNHVDIYWRERMRIVLDSPEGLSLRFQYLGLPLSNAEQKAFFARFGKDLEDLIQGKFENVERKLNQILFEQWKSGYIRKLSLECKLKKVMFSKDFPKDHFRFMIELQSSMNKRAITLGCRDDYSTLDGQTRFSVKSFFWWAQTNEKVEDSWLKSDAAVFRPVIGGISAGISWIPHSQIHAREFDHLSTRIFFTRNLIPYVDRIAFSVDQYKFIDWKMDESKAEFMRPSLGWPEPLSDDEQKNWRGHKFIGSPFARPKPFDETAYDAGRA